MKAFVVLLVAVTALTIANAVPLAHELDSTACSGCNVVVQLLHDTLGEDVFNNCIADFVAQVCTALGVEDNFVCKGLASDFSDTFIYVLDELVVEPKHICGILIADCDGGPDSLNQTWVMDMPGSKPTHKDPVTPKPGKPVLKVLQLSDLHVDNDYLIGAEAKCSEPLCCRPQGETDEGYLKDVKVPAGKWGTPGNCDAPYWLLTDMLAHIAKAHKDIDYIVVSGDLEAHDDWTYSKEGHMEKVKNISRTVKQYLPGIPAYFAIGNHEGFPHDNFAPHFTPEKFHLDWMYDTMATEYADWVPADQLDTLRYNGCFMKKLFPGLRLISLNNELGGESLNFYLYINQTDPDGTMTWFINQLADAEAAGDKVQIVAHIPGNSQDALEGWAINYYNAINRFEDTIVAQFFGHTHSEMFYITYENPNDPKSRATSVIYSAPSVTPNYDFNPTYRIYTIDGNYEGSSYQVLDFEEHFLNLSTANANPDAPTNWEVLYPSVKAEYGLKNLSAAEWSNLITTMTTDDATFQRYRRNKFRRDNMPVCAHSCKHAELCSCRTFQHNSDKMCADLTAKMTPTEKADFENYLKSESATSRRHLQLKSAPTTLTTSQLKELMDTITNNPSIKSSCLNK